MPDELKEIDYKDFEFLIMGEKIEFEITYEKGSLLTTLPAERPKVTRAEKQAAKVREEAGALLDKAIADIAAKARPLPPAIPNTPAAPSPAHKADTKPAAPAPKALPEAETTPAAPTPKAAPKVETKPSAPATNTITPAKAAAHKVETKINAPIVRK